MATSPTAPSPELTALESRVSRLEARLNVPASDSSQWQLEEALGSLVALETRVEALEVAPIQPANTSDVDLTQAEVLGIIHREQALLERRLEQRLTELEVAGRNGSGREIDLRQLVQDELATVYRAFEAQARRATPPPIAPAQIRQWVQEELAKAPGFSAPALAVLEDTLKSQAWQHGQLETLVLELRSRLDKNPPEPISKKRIEKLETRLTEVKGLHDRLRAEFNYFINGIRNS